MKEEKRLIMCGDIHGEFKELIWTLTERHKLKDLDVIVCGDIGMGFNKKAYYDLLFGELEKKLEKSGITLWLLRGNHDDPAYWNDGGNDRIKYLKDHVPTEIAGLLVYPIGGGVSEDVEWRLKENNRLKSLSSSRRVWWPDEEVVEIPLLDLPDKADLVVSHMAPISFDPFMTRREGTSLEVWEKSGKSREWLDKVRERLNITHWYHGHYHMSTSGTIGTLKYRGLGIMELHEHYGR